MIVYFVAGALVGFIASSVIDIPYHLEVRNHHRTMRELHRLQLKQQEWANAGEAELAELREERVGADPPAPSVVAAVDDIPF